MRNATLVLTSIVMACCLFVPQDASAVPVIPEAVRGVYELDAPVEAGFDTEILSMSLTPGQAQITDEFGNTFTFDSFFDVFTELSLSGPPDGTFRIDSFFDVFTELSIGSPSPSGGFDTEIVSMSLSGPVSMDIIPKPGGNQRTSSWQSEMLSISLSGSAPSTGGPVTVEMGLPSPGEVTTTKVGQSRFQIDSFFDVFTEISIDGGPPTSPSNPPRMTLRQSPSGQRCDQFYGVLGVNGVSDGGGTGWSGDGGSEGDWIPYPGDPGDPAPGWHNQWFYNDPLDTNRWKEIYWDIWLESLGADGDFVEVALNWSNEQYPSGTGVPPENSAAGELFIERFSLGQFDVGAGPGGVHLHRLEGTDLPFEILDYNPEWISIDVRVLTAAFGTEGVYIAGEICHECVPEPATMSLLALGGLAVIRRRRKA